MRLPLPFLLYITALGLFGWAGWTVYEMLPLWKREARDAASKRGIDDGVTLLGKGKGQGPTSADWSYGGNWWKQFTQVNLIGKLPPKVKTPAELAAEKGPEVPVVDLTPLEDLIELVGLVYDSTSASGDTTGSVSQVIIRYKPAANVEPPEWWVRENSPPEPGGAPSAGFARDSIPGVAQVKTTRATQRPPNGAAAPSSIPTSLTGREIQQTLWLDGVENERHGSRLWPPYEHIRLLRVAPDAQSAFFVRELPPPKAGEPAPDPKEEELLKTTMNLSQDVLQELRRVQGREGVRISHPGEVAAAAPGNAWREVEATTRFGNEFHIGRKDERQFRDSDDFFNNVYVDTYVSKTSKMRGISVRSVEPQIAQRFGLVTGDVLLEVNNRKVESKGQAFDMVKKDYKRGVRTFSTRWLSNGQVVERVYQAPPDK